MYGTNNVRYTIREEPALEKIVRPFETPRTWVGQRRLPPEQDEQEALLMWTADINVLVTTLDAQFIDPDGIRWELNNDKDPESEEEEDPVLAFEEVSRITSTVRVENPEDPSSWVDVERVDHIEFVAQNGLHYTYVFQNGEANHPPVTYI